jgi:hypothetical protein
VKIDGVEELFAKSISLPFILLTVSTWLREIQIAGFVDVLSERVDHKESLRERAQSVGGWKNLLRMIGRGFLYMFRSGEIRRKMMIPARFKRIIQQDRSTKRYIDALLRVGRKPSSE